MPHEKTGIGFFFSGIHCGSDKINPRVDDGTQGVSNVRHDFFDNTAVTIKPRLNDTTEPYCCACRLAKCQAISCPLAADRSVRFFLARIPSRFVQYRANRSICCYFCVSFVRFAGLPLCALGGYGASRSGRPSLIFIRFCYVYPVDLRSGVLRVSGEVGRTKGCPDLMTRRPQNGPDETDGRNEGEVKKKTLLKTNYSIVF